MTFKEFLKVKVEASILDENRAGRFALVRKFKSNLQRFFWKPVPKSDLIF